MNARNALVPATLAGLLVAAGCSSQAGSANAPAGQATGAPTVLATAAPSAVSINGTLVDCGPGRQALVQQSNGVAAVSCVVGAVNGFSVEAPLAAQPIGYTVAYPSAPLPRAAYEEPAYRPRTAARRVVVTDGRSWKKSAAIIGGSTAAGAGVGAVLDGGSGAKKGAVVGLVGGAIYDLATRNR